MAEINYHDLNWKDGHFTGNPELQDQIEGILDAGATVVVAHPDGVHTIAPGSRDHLDVEAAFIAVSEANHDREQLELDADRPGPLDDNPEDSPIH